MVPQAPLCTDSSVATPQIVEWFILRWQLEVTFEDARTHLGIETQRQWSDLAILLSTRRPWPLTVSARSRRRDLQQDA